jgi:PiT family inorganic phosphate transporter
MLDYEILAVLLVMLLAFANGSNDVSKAVATLVGSAVTNYRTAIAWGTMWTVLGALAAGFLANAMVKTFSKGLIASGLSLEPSLAFSVLIGAAAWVLFASTTGLPVSTTHALTGAIVGAGLVAVGSGGLLWPAILKKIALPLLVSPFLALTLSLVVHPAVRAMASRWEGTCLCLMPTSRALVSIDARGSTRTLFQAPSLGQPVAAVPAQCDQVGLPGFTVGLGTIHWLSSGLASFARGANDAPKIVAILLLGEVLSAWTPATKGLAFLAVAAAMGLGSLVGGLRVTEVLAEKVTPMDHSEGLSANLATSSIVLTAATVGLPVSTTHVSSSAIIGIGLLKGLRVVRWDTVRDMVLAWVATLPGAALLAYLAFLALSRLL